MWLALPFRNCGQQAAKQLPVSCLQEALSRMPNAMLDSSRACILYVGGCQGVACLAPGEQWPGGGQRAPGLMPPGST